MNTLQRVFWAHLLLATLSLAAAYLLSGQWIAGLVFALLGGLWALTARALLAKQTEGYWHFLARVWPMAGPLMFVYVIAATVGILSGFPTWLGLLAVTGALGAWDLYHFLRRLTAAGQVEYALGLGRSHLRHLLLVEGIGLAAGLLAFSARLRLSFWWVVLLAALAVIGMVQVLRQLRVQVDEE